MSFLFISCSSIFQTGRTFSFQFAYSLRFTFIFSLQIVFPVALVIRIFFLYFQFILLPTSTLNLFFTYIHIHFLHKFWHPFLSPSITYIFHSISFCVVGKIYLFFIYVNLPLCIFIYFQLLAIQSFCSCLPSLIYLFFS